MFKRTLAALGLITLAACDAAYPVAVVGPGGSVFRGQATALFLEGGQFQATNGAIVCNGTYLPAGAGETSTFPVRCSNGLSGVGTAVFQGGRSGGGLITMQDGSQWQFIFGRGALGV